jgi:hypothetical protein
MDDQLDNDLKNRIKEVFENFEDDSADAGWLELRKKFPEEKRDRRAFIWIWWGATAALVLLFLGIGLWNYNINVQTKKVTYNKLKHTQSEKINSKKNLPANTDTTLVATKNNLAKTNNSTGKSNPPNENNLAKTNNNVGKSTPLSENGLTKTNNSGRKSNAINENNLAKTNNGFGRSNPINENNLAKADISAKNSNLKKSLDKHNKYVKSGIAPQISLSDSLTTKVELAQAAANNKNKTADGLQSQRLNAAVKPNNEPVKPVVVVPKPPAKSINSMFADDKKAGAEKSIEKIEKRVRFGVYAATYFNYAKGSNNQVNVGAGVTSDIKLSKNLKLVTGVTVSQNSLYYASGTPVTVSNTVIVAQDNVKNPGASTTASYLGIAPSNYSVSAVATVKNYNASLIGLDIPLNLKYEFNPQKSDAYFSAGVSSGTFANETYTSQYSSQTYFSPSSQRPQGDVTTKSFNSFYFAKMLNVAFGVGVPLGKNRIILEPFLKYPIGGLGAQDIHFGASGLNLKFNFQSPKK